MLRPTIPQRPPPGFHVREATLADVEDLTRLWYASFNPSHEFWEVMTPDDSITRQWWNAAWTMGIKAGPSILKTFVVEDVSRSNRLVAFARWNVPQEDGSQEIPLPEYPSGWDADLTVALWHGMPSNRAHVMQKRRHWMLEFVGVDRAYQRHGLGFTLVDWGCQQADAAGLEVYLDATVMALPFYRKHFGFEDRAVLPIPTRPDSFGSYELMAVVRPARSLSVVEVGGKFAPKNNLVHMIDQVKA